MSEPPRAPAAGPNGRPPHAPEPLGGPGTPLPSGRRDEPHPAPPLAEPAVQVIVRRYPGTLGEVLRADFDEETKKLATTKDYAKFKPLVLVIDDAMKKLAEGLGYGDAKDGQGKVLDLGRADVAKLCTAVADLAAALAAKDALRDRLIDALAPYLLERAKVDGGLFAADGAAPPPAGAGAKPDPEALIRRRKDLVLASVGLATGLLRVLGVLAATLSGAEPKDAWKDRGKPALQGAAEIAAAVGTLASSAAGRGRLGALAGWLRANAPGVLEREEALAATIDRRLGLSEAKQAEGREARAKAREKAAKAVAETSDGKSLADECAKVLRGLSALIEAGLNAKKAWQAAFPADLAGTWELVGLPDDGLAWTVALEKGEGEHAFKGTAKVRGLEPVAVQRGVLGAVRMATEDRAALTLVAPPGGAKATLTWRHTPPKEAKLRAAGDAALRARGGAPAVEELAFESTRRLSGLSALGAPDGRARSMQLVRPLRFGQVLGLLQGVFEVLGAIPKALPTRWERSLKLWLDERVGPLLASLEGKLVGERLRALAKVVDFEWKDGKLRLGLAKGLSKVAATWNATAIIEHLLRDDRTIPEGQPSPFIPIAIEGAVKVPRIPGSIAIAWESWDPAEPEVAAARKKGIAMARAGERGIEEALNGLADWKATWDLYLAGLGAKYDVMPPYMRSAENLPALAIPLVVYLDRYVPEHDPTPFELRSKITLTVTIHAEIVATLFPQLRALLFAWDLGYSIGTFARRQLLKSEAYRAFERDLQQGLANRLGDADYHRALAAYGNHTARLLERGVITAQEAYLAWAKTGVFVWQQVLPRASGGLGRPGLPPDWDADRYAQWRDIWRQQLDRVRARDRAGGIDGQPAFVLAPRYVDTEAELLLLLFLWGDATITREEVLAAIDRGERGLGHALLPARAELLRLFASLRPAGAHKPDWERAEPHEQRIRALTAEEPRLPVPVGAGASARVDFVENPRWVEARRALDLIEQSDDYVRFARILTYGVRLRHLAVERLDDGRRSRFRLHWDAPGRAVEVQLFDDRLGPDRPLLASALRLTTAEEPVDLDAGRAEPRDTIQGALARWAAKERSGERAFTLYASVRAGAETWESQRWRATVTASAKARADCYTEDRAGKPTGGAGTLVALHLARDA